VVVVAAAVAVVMVVNSVQFSFTCKSQLQSEQKQ
jgi:hypothetical protein